MFSASTPEAEVAADIPRGRIRANNRLVHCNMIGGLDLQSKEKDRLTAVSPKSSGLFYSGGLREHRKPSAFCATKQANHPREYQTR
jgi:hypothetical protein